MITKTSFAYYLSCIFVLFCAILGGLNNSYSQRKGSARVADGGVRTNRQQDAGVDTARVTVSKGWNLISLPVVVSDGRREVLFPSATSKAYAYKNNYVQRDTLLPGSGYWLKFANPETIAIAGSFLTYDTIQLQSRWNLVGSLSITVPPTGRSSNPPNIIATNYYSYSKDNGYTSVSILEPGKGYWVKATQAGKLIQYCWEDPAQVLLSPLDKSSDLPLNETLIWRSSQCASSYHLQVSVDSIFNHFIINDSTLTDTVYQLNGLQYNGEFFWRIGVRSSNGETFWSKYSQFETVWKSAEFQGKSAFKMNIAWPYLYVCAGYDGLWRRTVDGSDSSWQYLGLADSSTHYPDLHYITDVDVYGNTILASMWHDHYLSPPSVADVAIWRTTNSGVNWIPSDSGMADSGLPSNSMWTVKRSPFDSSVVLADVGTTFLSSDGGHYWANLNMRGATTLYSGISWHPVKKNEVWYFGQGDVFDAYLARSIDNGLTPISTWNSNIDMPIGDTPVYGIAFDAVDSNTIYITGNYGVLKSSNLGVDWHQSNPQDLPWILHGQFRGLATHPVSSGEAYFTDIHTLYLTKDTGGTFKIKDVPTSSDVISLVYCEQLDLLYIGTREGGIISYKIQR